jgi:DedD protein
MGWGSRTELRATEARRDKEVTLGPLMLTALGLGLFALCSICFVAGYAVGHRGTATGNADASIQAPQTGRSAAEILSAAQTAPAQKQNAPAAPANQPPQPSDTSPTLTKADSAPPPPAVQANLPAQDAPPAQFPASPVTVHPAILQTTPQAGSWTVQVAAVEHADDADVLISALRRRGYAVSVRNDPGDRLLHVQVGPFASRSDADATRQKLLGDGYNAVVMQ